jgi:hypothetical protein
MQKKYVFYLLRKIEAVMLFRSSLRFLTERLIVPPSTCGQIQMILLALEGLQLLIFWQIGAPKN